MAMACVLPCPLSALALSSSHGSFSSSSQASFRLAGARLRLTAPVKVVYHHKRNGMAKAAAEEAVVEAAAPADPISSLKLQSEILKKKAKKEELRRKRLVRKRHLRKKGRWPPAKVNKTKNV